MGGKCFTMVIYEGGYFPNFSTIYLQPPKQIWILCSQCPSQVQEDSWIRIKTNFKTIYIDLLLISTCLVPIVAQFRYKYV